MEISREEHASVKRVVKKRKRRRSSTSSVGDPPKRWSDLPNDLLDSVKKRLFYIDQCNLSIVCKSWSCIEKQERNIMTPPLPQMPWLLVFDETTESCSKLVDSNNKKTYTIDTKTIKEQMNISHFKFSTFHESKHGWLLLSRLTYNIPNTTSFFMYSPFLNKNNNFIKLPILNVDKISLATFISNPLDDDFTVITLNTTLRKNAILVNTYRRGQDSWNSQVFRCEFSLWDVRRWMYSERIFYYITDYGKVGMFDLTREDWNDFPSPPLEQKDLSFGKFYMVKSNHKELLLIVEHNLLAANLHTSKNWCYSRISRHHIFRLDLLSMIWKDSTSIDENRVLFIGDAYNCVLNSSVLKSNGVLLRKGMSDTIYYCLGEEVTYVTIDECPAEGYKGYFERQKCSRLYGCIARKKGRKLLIDPPLIEPATNDI